MILTFLLLSLVILVQFYVIYNLYTKYGRLETEYDKTSIKLEEDNSFIQSLRSRIMSQRSYLKQLDRRGAFESDDEVGYFFKELKKIINDISSYFDIPNEQSDADLNNEFMRRFDEY
jgi:ppGpp synthetase/RelA/SpoT-type nucleotidyltranferase